MSHSISRSIATSFKNIATNIDNIIDLLETEFHQKDLKYQSSISGSFSFTDSGTNYRYSNLNQFKDALAGENLDDVYIWRIGIDIKGGSPKTEEYLWSDIVGLDFESDVSTQGNRNGTRLSVDTIEYAPSRILMDKLVKILKTEYFKFIPENIDSEEADRIELADQSFDILDNLLPLQAKIIKPFEDEKDFQRFLFPILKSHFPTLQEEDYLPKLAGKASKPDFGIINRGIAFEVKFNKGQDLMKLRKEILIDSREYFGKNSPYKTMVVSIYNSSGQPIPANFIEDLEDVDVIHSVAISPPVIPAQKIIQ